MDVDFPLLRDSGPTVLQATGPDPIGILREARSPDTGWDYFFNSAFQFTTTTTGSDTCSSRLLIRNRLPSGASS